MRTVVLNGSPHPSGNGMRLANRLIGRLGGEWETIDLYDAGISPCRGCERCGGVGGCVIADGMEGVLRKVLSADCLIMVSPIHFSSLSAPLIAFIGRLQMIWRKQGAPAEKRGCGILLVTGGSEYPGMFEPARKVAAAAFKTLNRPFTEMLAISGTDAAAPPDHAAALAALASRIKGDGGEKK